MNHRGEKEDGDRNSQGNIETPLEIGYHVRVVVTSPAVMFLMFSVCPIFAGLFVVFMFIVIACLRVVLIIRGIRA
ncbi:hypothetical protein [Desulfatiglans anilini]|uniref:hypothetical protein n=1 Tax=Desulfatiglans anilini TaxID=90728 RepID=UPI001FC94424|nr:hypothetical protein [Desulfatiglans anilini]